MARPGRVLFCALGYEPGPVGGAERQARLQAEELVRRGWTVEIVTARDPGTVSGPMGGVLVHRLTRLNRRPFRTVTYLPILGWWLLRNVGRYDLVHVHLANLQADVAGVACRLRRVPLYVKLAAGGTRGEIARMRPVAWLTRFVGLRSAARVQATSSEIVDDLRAIRIPGDRIVRIPNGLPSGTYAPVTSIQREQRRTELGLPAHSVLFLYAGRFARYKGVLDLVEAWRSLPIGPPAQLVIVGAPAIDDPVEIPALPDVVVRPWTASVASYLEACDAYVHPSHADGMPNAVLEAMSAGLAVVATRVAAIPEMIEDGVTGLLVPVGDITALRSAIARLRLKPELRAELGRAAAEHVREVYPIESVVDRIEQAYRGIVGDLA